MFLIVQRPGHNIWIRCTYSKYYAPKYKCLSNHINSTLNCVQGSLDLRSLRSSDKLTARYFSVGKKINSLLLSIENLRLLRRKTWMDQDLFPWKGTKTWPNGKTFRPPSWGDGLYNVSDQLFYNKGEHLKPWNSLNWVVHIAT